MKIELPKSVEFDTLKQGEVFLLYNEYYMKIEYVLLSDTSCNAVNLRNGTIHHINANTKIKPMPNAVLMVDGGIELSK